MVITVWPLRSGNRSWPFDYLFICFFKLVVAFSSLNKNSNANDSVTLNFEKLFFLVEEVK